MSRSDVRKDRKARSTELSTLAWVMALKKSSALLKVGLIKLDDWGWQDAVQGRGEAACVERTMGRQTTVGRLVFWLFRRAGSWRFPVFVANAGSLASGFVRRSSVLTATECVAWFAQRLVRLPLKKG